MAPTWIRSCCESRDTRRDIMMTMIYGGIDSYDDVDEG